MADPDDVLARLIQANEVVSAADLQRDVAMRDRDELLREARASGITWAAIRAATGLSPTTINKALSRNKG